MSRKMIAVGVAALLVLAALSAAFVHFRSAEGRAWVAAIERSRDLALGGHPKPAINRHLKTGN